MSDQQVVQAAFDATAFDSIAFDELWREVQPEPAS